LNKTIPELGFGILATGTGKKSQYELSTVLEEIKLTGMKIHVHKKYMIGMNMGL
jgi:hypothetical protein